MAAQQAVPQASDSARGAAEAVERVENERSRSPSSTKRSMIRKSEGEGRHQKGAEEDREADSNESDQDDEASGRRMKDVGGDQREGIKDIDDHDNRQGYELMAIAESISSPIGYDNSKH